MDDPGLSDLFARNQQGMAGAAGLSLFFGACYAILRQLDFKRSLLAMATGALFAASIWMFLAEQWHVALVFFIPVAVVSGFGAFPIVRAYVSKSDEIADGAVGAAGGFVKKWLARFGFGGSP